MKDLVSKDVTMLCCSGSEPFGIKQERVKLPLKQDFTKLNCSVFSFFVREKDKVCLCWIV